VQSKRAVRLGAGVGYVYDDGKKRVFVAVLYVVKVERSVENAVAATMECCPCLAVDLFCTGGLNVEL
jgi:hypothetical protein